MTRARLLLVAPDAADLPKVPGALAVRVEDFLAAVPTGTARNATVINLCPTLRYRSRGYYVSLLCEARGLKVIPTLESSESLADPHAMFRGLQLAHIPSVDRKEMQSRRRAVPAEILPDDDDDDEAAGPVLLRRVGRDDELSFRPVTDAECADQVVCFGRCLDDRFQTLARRVYQVWPAPAMRVRFIHEDDEWKVVQVTPLAALKLKGADRDLLLETLRRPEFLRPPRPVAEEHMPSIAILYDEMSLFAPSTTETMEKLERVAARKGVLARRIGMNEMNRLGEYDAVFIRAYTSVTSPVFQFALRAESLGKPVLDDTQSIIRCSNKVFLHELLTREGVPTPRSVVSTPHTPWAELARLGLPFVIKLPDGAFSAAVHKVESKADYLRHSKPMFQQSPLLISQEWLPTEYDWRVTVLDGKVLFTCKYFMARGHWRIRAEDKRGISYGKVEAVHRDHAPREVTRVALRACRAVGNGLYGVDLKDTRRGPVVIEINDNPNIDVGYEDRADGDVIFEDLIDCFTRRIERARQPKAEPRERDQADTFVELRRPIGPRTLELKPAYRAFEVCGLELEYPVVDRDLNVVSRVADAFQEYAGRPSSDVDLGLVGFSNEIFDHVLEVKTAVPVRSLVQAEEALVEGIRRFSTLLARRFEARLLPTGMHPWFLPAKAKLWNRSNARIYATYERLFDVHTHGWANVQACHVNLPFGQEHETVAMLNASAMLMPYLPAIAASSPLAEGDLQPAVDNRMAHIVTHQARLPESCGDLIPEPCTSLAQYRRDILGGIYRALDRLPDAGPIRQEFANARAAVLKFSRRSLEIRCLDMQECVKMDAAIAAFTRAALRALTQRTLAGKLARPQQSVLVADFNAVIHAGTRAQVSAPHLGLDAPRDRQGRHAVRAVLTRLLEWARDACRADEQPYMDLVQQIIASGSLSERIRSALEPSVDNDEAFTEAARRIYAELSECLETNTPWHGRGFSTKGAHG